MGLQSYLTSVSCFSPFCKVVATPVNHRFTFFVEGMYEVENSCLCSIHDCIWIIDDGVYLRSQENSGTLPLHCLCKKYFPPPRPPNRVDFRACSLFWITVFCFAFGSFWAVINNSKYNPSLLAETFDAHLFFFLHVT